MSPRWSLSFVFTAFVTFFLFFLRFCKTDCNKKENHHYKQSKFPSIRDILAKTESKIMMIIQRLRISTKTCCSARQRNQLKFLIQCKRRCFKRGTTVSWLATTKRTQSSPVIMRRLGCTGRDRIVSEPRYSAPRDFRNFHMGMFYWGGNHFSTSHFDAKLPI